MNTSFLLPKQSINKAYLKVKPVRPDINNFKKCLNSLLLGIADVESVESEEHLKKLAIDFLQDTFYKDQYYLNTKIRTDLVIHNGRDAKTNVAVLVEVKRPLNKVEMVNKENFNKKALHGLILRFLQERENENNNDLKYIIATNIYEWYIVDASDFERVFHKNRLVKEFKKWEGKEKISSNTDLFYDEITKKFVNESSENLNVTHFDLRDYKIESTKKEDEKRIISLYKIFSPEHLLKLPFANDSNNLDRKFYNELLHIIGLEEVKVKNKKLILRKPPEKRDEGSLLENTILTLETEDRLTNIENIDKYGVSKEDKLFNVALELNITWINRVLFLKLLEAQLYKYHHKNDDYKFLNINKIWDFDTLNKLFFQVLAVKPSERNPRVKKSFNLVPYLNSSLFEINKLENKALRINSLEDEIKIKYHTQTVLKNNGKTRKGNAKCVLSYLFEFLEAYDFSSEGSEEIQEENKTLINASVLGLIFEKINGYKDGSFFTPGFITMYMCRETIRRAVLQKFNEKFGWNCEEFDDLKNYLADKRNKSDILDFNKLINSLTICDPAVGSGHFLVSALNEIIAIKSELGILADNSGVRISDYEIKVENDELVIINVDDSEFFEYHLINEKPNQEIQRMQKTLFHEKQTIIENSLFGVDINQNSVKIARLRLWIELLKNAYYTEGSNFKELETLPNIDINIKQGNSLISMFSKTDNIFTPSDRALVDLYKIQVGLYKNAHDKEEKKNIRIAIEQIKEKFTGLYNDPMNDQRKKLRKLNGELHDLEIQILGFEDPTFNKKREKLVNQIDKLTLKIIKNEEENEVLFQDAFEWRFEFPEVLTDNGDFIGFDIVIGNPPYSQLQKLTFDYSKIKNKYFTYEQTGDIYVLFYEQGYNLLNVNGLLCYITSNKWMRANYGKNFREFLIQNMSGELLIDFNYFQVFDEASVDTNILLFGKGEDNLVKQAVLIKEGCNLHEIEKYVRKHSIRLDNLSESYWNIVPPKKKELNTLFVERGRKIKDWAVSINYGIKTGLNEAFIIDESLKNELVKKDPKNVEIIVPCLRGRDVRRYGYEYEDFWLINTHNGVKELGIDPIDVEKDYPTIFEYLSQYKDKAFVREDQGNHWTNLRNCKYINDFKKEKLIYAETMRIHKSDKNNFPRFGYDGDGNYCDKTVFIVTGENLRYLLALLNSKVGNYLIREYVTKLDAGGYMMQKIFLDEIPIIEPDENEELSTKINQILETKSKLRAEDIIKLESEIDLIVYKLYDLTWEHVKIVDPEFSLTKDEYENY